MCTCVVLIHLNIVTLLLPYVPTILELVQRSLADEERPESIVKLAMGLVGDLADAFPNGEIKQFLLTEWLAQALRQKTRLSGDAKKTVRWAREVGVNTVSLLTGIVLI